MDKINSFVEVSVVDLLTIAEKCSAIIADVTSLIKEKAFEDKKEASSEEAPKTTEEKPNIKEPTFEDGVLKGLTYGNFAKKPIEMVTE